MLSRASEGFEVCVVKDVGVRSSLSSTINACLFDCLICLSSLFSLTVLVTVLVKPMPVRSPPRLLFIMRELFLAF